MHETKVGADVLLTHLTDVALPCLPKQFRIKTRFILTLRKIEKLDARLTVAVNILMVIF